MSKSRMNFQLKSDKLFNIPHAPPDSLQESIEDSSVCNIEDSSKELSAIGRKQESIESVQLQQIMSVVKQQRQKIFGSKMRTQDDVVNHVFLEIEKHKTNNGISSQAKNNPFQLYGGRKHSEQPCNSDRDPIIKQPSTNEQTKLSLKPFAKPFVLNRQQSPNVPQSQLYTQLAAQIKHNQQPLIAPKETKHLQQSYNSSQMSNIQMKTGTTNTPASELNKRSLHHTTQNGLQSPNSNSSQQSQIKYFIEDQKSESFQHLIHNQQMAGRLSISKSGSQASEVDLIETQKIANILSESNLLDQLIKQRNTIHLSSVRSETNVFRPILAFKKLVPYKCIIETILNNDIKKFNQYMSDSKQQYINTPDVLGNNILILAIKLCGLNPKYNDMLKEVFKHNPNPFLKNTITGWSAMDESLSQRSVFATALLFQQCYKTRRNEFNSQIQTLTSALKQVPNFTMEMHWNFDSPLPFIKMLAPNDTIKLWKYDCKLRLDSTLVGFSNLQCKRRDMSLIFSDSKLLQINRTNKFYTDPLEELDFDEKKLIIHDILNCEPVNGAIDIISCQLKESFDWRGKRQIEQIGQYQTEKYDLKITYKSTIIKKSNDTQQKFQVERELYDEWIQHDIKPNTDLLLNGKAKEHTETRTISLWVCKNHALKFQDFNNIVNLLAKGNQMVDKLAKVFQRPEIQQLLALNGFPIKVQIPIQFSVHATIQFINFTKLSMPQDLFVIQESNYQPRKKAQKTMEQKKKRLLLANMYL